MINKILLILTVIFHYFIFLCLVMSAIAGVFILPWFIGFALGTLIVRVMVDRTECPITTIENHFRKKLDLKNSTGFLKDYILYPQRTFKYLKDHLL